MVVHLLKNYVEKKFFFEKIFVYFTKYTLYAEKVFLYGKRIILKNVFAEKNFFTKKDIYENV